MTSLDLKRTALLAATVIAAAMPLTATARDKYEAFVAGAQIVEVLWPYDPTGCTASASPFFATGTIQGTGLGVPIGAFTVASLDCVTANNPELLPPYAFSSKVLTLTTRNGDQIVASYSGSAELQPTGLLRLTGTYTITSGTGEYKGVKGSGTLVGVEDINTFPARGFVTLSGTIAR